MPTITDRGALPWLRRLAWFVGLWIGGVVSIGAVAGVLRWILHR